MRTARSSLDLLAAIALALVGLAAALFGLEGWIGAVLSAPLALACGYPILAALLPEAKLPPGERLVYVIALGLGATTLGGIVVQIFLALDRPAWAILLTVLTVVAAAVALRRRRARAPRAGAAAAGDPRPRLALPGPLASLLVAAAVAVAVGAVVISSAGAKRERDGYHFTALWAQPVQAATGTGQAVAIGVDNHQGATAHYRLVVKQGPATLVSRKLVLADGARFRLRLRSGPISQSSPVTVDLNRNGAVFRQVYLENTAG